MLAKRFKPPQEDIDIINAVWDRYGVEKEEAQFEKKRIMIDWDDAIMCYKDIYAES